MSNSAYPKHFIGWGNLAAGILCLFGLAIHTGNLITSRMPASIYAGTLYVRIPLELTIDLLIAVGGWKLCTARGERVLLIGNSSWLGYSLAGLLIAFDNADPSHLQIGTIRNILGSKPVSEWRNLIVVGTLVGVAANSVMLGWSIISVRSCLLQRSDLEVIPKPKEKARWPLALLAFALAIVSREFLRSVEMQAGFYRK
jgi:hypothetical protein